MLITRKSRLTGAIHKKEIECTQQEYESFLQGFLVQRAFPNMSADDREFMLSGITPEEWEKYFKEIDND